jgi:hypothetical protein
MKSYREFTEYVHNALSEAYSFEGKTIMSGSVDIYTAMKEHCMCS